MKNKKKRGIPKIQRMKLKSRTNTIFNNEKKKLAYQTLN